MKKIIIALLLISAPAMAAEHVIQGGQVTTSSITVGASGIRFNDGTTQTTAGGGGTPGGSTGQLQYNNAGSFGGAPSVVTASSITLKGTGGLSVDYGVTAGSFTANGTGNGQVTMIISGGNYNAIGSSITTTVGHLAVYSSTNGTVGSLDPSSLGGGGGSAAPLCIITSSETISATGDFTVSGCSIPANTLTAGKVLRVVVAGFASTGATDGQVGFGLKYGSTDIQQSRTTYTAGSQTNNGFVGHFYNTVKTAGASGAVYSEGSSIMENSAGTASAFIHKLVGTTTINTTATTTLYVSGTMPASASMTLTQFLVYVE